MKSFNRSRKAWAAVIAPPVLALISGLRTGLFAAYLQTVIRSGNWIEF